MTKRKIDGILIVDCEATCEDDPIWTRENGELIQISVIPICLRTWQIRKELAYTSFVKPLKTGISTYCTNLTGIKDSDVENAPLPDAVFKEINARFSKNYVWGSWGRYDIKLIQSTASNFLRDHGLIEYPFPEEYYNLKNLYSILNGMRTEVGLKKALIEENLQFEGQEHDAYWDTLNTAKVILKTLKRSITE